MLTYCPEQYRVLRLKGTERAFTGVIPDERSTAEAPTQAESYVYACAGCNTALYRPQHKFESACGWPAFFNAFAGRVRRQRDTARWDAATEIVCAKCNGHLGHVFFGENFGTATNERQCVNAASLVMRDATDADEACDEPVAG